MPSKEYLEMLKGEMPEPEPLPEQTKKDKAKNFWLYHKTYFAIGTITAVIIAFFIYDIVTQVEPDVNFALITEMSVIPTEVTDALQADLAAYVEDLNGDGEIVAMLNVYSVADTTSTDPYMQMASVTKLTGDMSEMVSYIYLTDNFEMVQESYEIFADKDDHTVIATTAEQAGYNLSDTNLTPLTTEFEDSYHMDIYESIYEDFMIVKRINTYNSDKDDRRETFEVGTEIFNQITQ